MPEISRPFAAAAASESHMAHPDPLELPFGMVPKTRSVVLTFDDGPDRAGHTDRILDILEAKSAPACFFVTTCNREAKGALPSHEQAAATLRRMRAAGHDIGNHTASHPELKDLPIHAIVAEDGCPRTRRWERPWGSPTCA